MSTKKCYICDGYGLIKTKIIYCDNCNGSKCYKCRGTGLQYGWSDVQDVELGSEGKETEFYDRVHVFKKTNK